VEIEPAVVHAAPYLTELNRGGLRDNRVHIIIDDARHYLLSTQDTYDLIVSEPSNPWVAGVASLFTDEFYSSIRGHLRVGGMLVQWVQAYSIFPEDLKMVLATVANRFPEVSVWRGQWVDLILLAQSEPAVLSLDRIKHFWATPQLQDDYQELSLSKPESIIGYYLLGDWDLRRLVNGAFINTDDLTRLEYRSPRAIFDEKAGPQNIDMLYHASSSLLPASLFLPDARTALCRAAETLETRGEIERERRFLQALEAYRPSAETELRGKWFLESGHLDHAREAFENVLRLEPTSQDALLGLARVALLQREYGAAESYLDKLLERSPQFGPALELYATLAIGHNDWARAADWELKVVNEESRSSTEELGKLAELLVNSGQTTSAEFWCDELLKRDPYNAAGHRALGIIRERQRRWEEARSELEFVERYYPVWDSRIYALLAKAYRNLDRSEDADAVLKKGQRLFPGDASLQNAIAAVSGLSFPGRY
jgi:tetratricopeptide (TPR) repeat protein